MDAVESKEEPTSPEPVSTRQTAPTTTKHLRPIIMEALKDGEWHHFAEIMSITSNAVMPEQAVRMFNNMRKDRKGARPIDEQIAAGRRRAAYVEVGFMVRAGQVLCKNEKAKPNDREFKINPNPPTKDRKKERGKAIAPDKGQDKSVLLVALRSTEELIRKQVARPNEKDDLAFHFRAISRIVSATSPG